MCVNLCRLVNVSGQEPTASVNVRFDAAQLAALDEYATYLGRKRVARVTRSDVLRLALARLPVPKDAHAELRTAMDAIGASS